MGRSCASPGTRSGRRAMTLDLKAVEARLDRADIGDYPHDDAMDDVADLLAALREHRDLLRKIAAKHQGCDDGFYACPRSEDYFGQYVDDEVPEIVFGAWARI